MVGDLQRVVGSNLRALRVKIGLSQEQFAEHLAVHRTYMGAVERGERNLTLQTVERLAERLEVPVHSLFEVSPSAVGAAGAAGSGPAAASA